MVELALSVDAVGPKTRSRAVLDPEVEKLPRRRIQGRVSRVRICRVQRAVEVVFADRVERVRIELTRVSALVQREQVACVVLDADIRHVRRPPKRVRERTSRALLPV